MTEIRDYWLRQLTGGTKQLSVGLDYAQCTRMLDYLEILERWNRRFNLTAVRDPATVVPRHLLDSLSIADLIRGTEVLDMGSGAGLPGLPLAIALPDRNLTLLDANGKKTRFLEHCRMAIGLENLRVVHSRVEDHRPGGIYNTVVSRAFSSLPEIVRLSSHLLAPGGYWLAMKGELPQTELQGLQQRGFAVQVRKLNVPQTEGIRNVVICQEGARQ